MIKIENVEVFGWETAIRGMRNPMNSWDKSDSLFLPVAFCDDVEDFKLAQTCGGKAPIIKENDLKLMKTLAKAGNDHGKFLRMINVTLDITAPLYWWKEFDTYKVGTVANSCSTMHKIAAKVFTIDDFSNEHLEDMFLDGLRETIRLLNIARDGFIRASKEENPLVPAKDYWWQMIQLLPSSYNQKRTVQLNYQVLKTMYYARKEHKLDEWREFCKWIEELPYFREIVLNADNNN